MSYISSVRQSNPAIREDENWRKAWSCVPVVGIMFSWTQEVIMTEKLLEATPQQKIELIEVNTKYRICDIVRNGLTVVLAIIAVVAGILPPLGFALACTYAALGALHAYGNMGSNEEQLKMEARLAMINWANSGISQVQLNLGP